jgi:hypothetical protein
VVTSSPSPLSSSRAAPNRSEGTERTRFGVHGVFGAVGLRADDRSLEPGGDLLGIGRTTADVVGGYAEVRRLDNLAPEVVLRDRGPGRASSGILTGTPREIASSGAPTPVTGCDAGSSAAFPVTAPLPPCVSSPPPRARWQGEDKQKQYLRRPRFPDLRDPYAEHCAS